MDIASYQLNERLASAVLPSWRLKALHSPHVFVSGGFPVRVQSTDELIGLLDTMQENRFDAYVQELGGLDDKDFSLLVDALTEYCLFFRVNFPGRKAPLPLSTMVAHLALAKKLRALGRPYRMLEIGPGCGYLSFFLKDWEDLEVYSQIESTESFYILQNLVNKHVFRHRFRDHAQANIEEHAASFVTDPRGAVFDTEISPQASLDLPTRCRHYPWWRIGEVARERFHIVTSNANLNEFSEPALAQYAWLIDQCLEPDGVLLVQCFGGGPLPLDRIFSYLVGIRLVPVVAVLEGTTTVNGKCFAKSNLLMVRERHPVFGKYATQSIAFPRFESNDLLVRAVYGSQPSEGRRKVSAAEVVTAVGERLKGIT